MRPSAVFESGATNLDLSPILLRYGSFISLSSLVAAVGGIEVRLGNEEGDGIVVDS
jgi:hypothetical protein